MFRFTRESGLRSTLLLLILALAQPAAAEVRVVATLRDLASITALVGGDRVHVDWIVDGKRDAHYVEVLPSYMLKVKRADLFLKVGLDMEPWAPGIIHGARNAGLHIVDCSRGIELLERPTGPVDASMGDIHISGNPHYWLDPSNGARIARTIVEGLIYVDPEGEPFYRQGLVKFEDQLQRHLARWKQRLAPFAGASVVYFHNSWPYFNRAFELSAAGFVEPKPGVSPSPGHTAGLTQRMQKQGIRVVAMAPYFHRKVPESVARSVGAQLVVLATSVGGIEGADDYFGLFEANTSRLVEALGATP